MAGREYQLHGGSIVCENGVYRALHPDRACAFVTWDDLCAFADWAGLRPMTELEFEKACRGGLLPVANEFAWGTTTIASSAYTLANNGSTNEGINTGFSVTSGNCSYSTTDGVLDGPLRVGAFAANGASTGRFTAGAGAPGIMELSGNVNEFVVDLFNFGVDYTGTHGDGTLNSFGGHTTATCRTMTWAAVRRSGVVGSVQPRQACALPIAAAS